MMASAARHEMLGSSELWGGDSVSTFSTNQMECFDASSRRVSGFPCFRGRCQRHSIDVIPHVEVGDAPPWRGFQSNCSVMAKQPPPAKHPARHAHFETSFSLHGASPTELRLRVSLAQLGIQPAGPMGMVIDFGDPGYLGDVARPGRHRMAWLLI